MQVYSMDYLTDRLVLLAVENSQLLRDAIYSSLQVATAEFPKLLTLCSVFYWSVLYEKSRNKIDALLKSKMPSVLYRKFNILTQVMRAEPMTVDTFLSAVENLKQLKEKLPMIGVNIDLNTDGLKKRITDQVNMHVDDIVKLLENYMKTIEGYLKIDEYFKKAQEILNPEELSKMRQEAQAQALKSVDSLNPFKRGGTKRKRRRTRRTKRKGGTYSITLQTKNRFNFGLWNLKDSRKYQKLDEKIYYPNPGNRFSLSGQDPKNLSLLGETPQPISWKKRVAKHCLRVGYDDREKCINDNCSPYSMNDPSCNRVIDKTALNEV